MYVEPLRVEADDDERRCEFRRFPFQICLGDTVRSVSVIPRALLDPAASQPA
jgi:hypothetical protein